MALIFAAIDQQVSLLLQGDALYALLQGQSIESLEIKNYLKAFGTLSLYDIEHIYVCEHSMKQRGLDITRFAYDIITLDTSEKQALLQQQHQVVTI
ncbi:tRNA 2-thiouridine synthesizing protein C [Pseudoalteromonas spongiae UST010723-006]|nr:tRNA 2-thiouridine synthesizing protein C [Pseudoalteromonas spongiae UST010723-006]